jgi:type II secretory pathway pseudopilin PulG
VELLVVITIIGMLVALLLPAVTAAREAGRKATCSNNLKQVGLACLAHESGQGYYPSGGWGSNWVGDPSLGFGKTQPGSWLYSILPNLDNDTLYKMGGSDSVTHAVGLTQMTGATQCIGTALPFMNCPSRRRAVAYPCSYTPSNSYHNANVARGDYAANAGDVADAVLQWAGPAATTGPTGGLTYYAAANWLNYFPQCQGYQYNTASQVFTSYYGEPNGVIYTGSQVRKDDISDGVTNTYLLGEKYLVPEDYTNYTNNKDTTDTRCMYSGCTIDNERSTYESTPLQDRSNVLAADAFGSAHVNSCCFAFCDGSVHWISYNIDAPTHQILGCRNDGQTVDISKF